MLPACRSACITDTGSIRVYGGDKPHVPQPDHWCHRAARSVYVFVNRTVEYRKWRSIILNYSGGRVLNQLPLYRCASRKYDRFEIQHKNHIDSINERSIYFICIFLHLYYMHFCIYRLKRKEIFVSILKGRNIFNSLSRNTVIIKFGEKYYNYQNEL